METGEAGIFFYRLDGVYHHLLALCGLFACIGRAYDAHAATGKYEYKIPFEIHLRVGNSLLNEKLLVMMTR